MTFFQGVKAIVAKDLSMEIRGKEIISTTFMFSLLTVVIFNFAFDMAEGNARESAAGVLWVAFLFSGALTMNRGFMYEKDEDCMSALMLAPIDRSAIFFGKMLSSLLFMLATMTIITPIFILLYNVNVMERPLWQALSFFLGATGFITVGTLIAAISVNLRAREMMGPLLLLPVVAPVVIAAVKFSGGLIMNQPVEQLMIWMKVLLIFNVVYLVVAWMVFDNIIEES